MKKVIISLACGAALFCGCNKPTNQPSTVGSYYELVIVTNRDSTVYELNKINGELRIVSGSEYTTLKVSDASPSNTNSYLIDWGSMTINSQATNSLDFKLKTKWKSGSAHYVLTISPYDGLLEREFSYHPAGSALTSAEANSALNSLYPTSFTGPQVASPPLAGEPEVDLNFYDADGFQLNVLRIGLSQMSLGTDSKGGEILTLDSVFPCSREDYQSVKSWGVGWRGFQ
jgi:hypothetical protein